MKILLIDDSELIRQRLSKYLSTLPQVQQIFEAAGQAEGLALLAEHQPELLILDISLPEGSGIHILEQIHEKKISTRVLVFTNYPFPQIEKRCLELGAEYFFSKSTDYERVKEVIAEMLDQSKSQLTPQPQIMTKKLLVVDDSPTMRRMVISSLQELTPVQFEQAESGLSAIEKLALYKFDLVILDLNMPDMHGMEVLKFIRKHQMYQDIPVIILTTKGDEKTRKEALDAGATMYCTKPYLPSVFAGEVKSLLNR